LENNIIRFKEFSVLQEQNSMKVGTDGVLLGSCVPIQAAKSILDIGTGTGIVALFAAQRNQEAFIDAIDIDDLAAKEAAVNFQKSPWKERLQAHNMSVQDYAAQYNGHYDHITCNPPFFSGGTLSSSSDKDAVRHTVKLGHGELLIAVTNLLDVNGKFTVILPYIEALRFSEMSKRSGLYPESKIEIRNFSGLPIERLLVPFVKKEVQEVQVSEINIYESEGVYSKKFLDCTHGFYE